jgi:hypothetical protein
MADTAADVAATYLDAWRAGDFDGLRRMSKIMTDIVVRKTFVDGNDVLTWFDLHTADTDPLPTVNWRHVEDGKIAWIRVTFDPRPLTQPGG